ncbi:MAG: hypothetical protein H0U76_21470 [Ktedonobacteraceae bacterium]|nr:hypothetical protein [Ktedonobacteraceae bacterium]
MGRRILAPHYASSDVPHSLPLVDQHNQNLTLHVIELPGLSSMTLVL